MEPVRRRGSRRSVTVAGGIALAGLMVAVLALNLVAGHARFIPRFLNPDALWTLAFFKDVIEQGGSIADWNVGQHADFFPDRFFAAAAYFVTSHHEDWFLVYAALNDLYFFAIAWYCLYVCRRRACGPSNAAIATLLPAVLAGALPLFARSWGQFDWFLHYNEFPTQHFGSFFGSVLAAIIALDCLDRPVERRALARLALAFVLLLLCVLSDKLVILVVVPAFVTAVFHAGVVRRPTKPMLPIAAVALSVAAGLAYALNDWWWRHFLDLSPARPRLHLDTLGDQGTIFLHALFRPGHPVQQAAAAVLIGAMLWLSWTFAVRVVRSLAGRRSEMPDDGTAPIVVYLVATTFLNPAAVVALGLMPNDQNCRYAFPALYCALLALAAKLAMSLPAWRPGRFMLATGVVCLPLLVVPINLAAPPFVRAPTLALARCLETLGRERELALGLGRFWDTYPVLFASGGKIRVLTMNGTVPARHWANDLAWYAPRGDGRRFTFIIMSNQWPDHEALRAAYGLPAEVLECARLGPGYGDRVIWAYDRPGAERLTAVVGSAYLELRAAGR